MGIKRDLLTCYYYTSSFVSKKIGITNSKREKPIIITLTSWEKRLPTLYLTIETLLNQSIKPDRIVLWLPKNVTIPKTLYKPMDRGLEIRYCQDIGPYTKIIYALQEFPDSLLVTCDDDILYRRVWLEELYSTYMEYPDYIICHRAHFMSKDKYGNLLPYNDWLIESPGIIGPILIYFQPE